MTASSFYFSEMAVEGGQPAWLVDFSCGLDHWRYNTTAYDIDYGGVEYAHEPGLVIGKHEVGDNEIRNSLQITLNWSTTLIAQLLTDPPDAPIAVTVIKGHTDQNEDYETFGAGIFGAGIFGGHAWLNRWSGWIQNHELKSDRQAVVTCTPWWSDIGMAGSCQRSSKTCQFVFGSAECGVDLATYQEDGTILTVDGDTITAALFATHADDYYTGGVLTAGDQSRMMIAHTGNTVILSHVVIGLAAADTFTCTPGCDHEWDGSCLAFDNQINCGCQPHRPTRNFVSGGLLGSGDF